MEITCKRCHQVILAENCYCASCGLPQLVYSSEALFGSASAEPGAESGAEPVRDADTIAWKSALRAALLLAIPAGLLSSVISPLGTLGLLWMLGASAWAVALYVRGQKVAWVTLGAGARIGLVTGLLGGWLAFGVSSGALFADRYAFHHASQIDSEWKLSVEASQQMTKSWTASLGTADAAHAQAAQEHYRLWMLSPEGHACFAALGYASYSLFLLCFSVIGGVIGARMMARSRLPEV